MEIREADLTKDSAQSITIPMCCSDPTPEINPRVSMNGGEIKQEIYCANCDTDLAVFTFSQFDAEQKAQEELLEVEANL